MDTKKLQLYFFIGLLLIVLGMSVALFAPFLVPIALAFMAAIVTKPVHQWILNHVNKRKSLAAALATIFVLVVILAPLGFIVSQVTIESYQFYSDARDGSFDTSLVTSSITQPIQRIFPNFDLDVESMVRDVSESLVTNARTIFSNTAKIALAAFITIVALFYMLRDGETFRRAIVRLSPLNDTYDNDIIEKVEQAVNSVVRGSLFTALLKGVLAAGGFAVFGVPHPVLWGALTIFVSFLPGVGAGLTLIPAVAYLFLQNSVGASIGLAVWGALVVGLIDNILMPIVVGKGFTVHPLIVLLSVLGGIVFFGPVGIFLGPLVIALLSALLEIYKLIVLDDQNRKTTSI